ncbi:uncharacterized protein LAJ45_08717 [Morchella importuna]|uniref:uncharacterized protein n=1 Tax=Morchella importuna TaxID=1174673 RepID=UPI001E8D9B2E|nr:uncharacterized protein LAJ45_08717 [Morchella importuna]KAH8147239.1 hypothetical protein LAJ45_08717 [Morchella importuna]
MMFIHPSIEPSVCLLDDLNWCHNLDQNPASTISSSTGSSSSSSNTRPVYTPHPIVQGSSMDPRSNHLKGQQCLVFPVFRFDYSSVQHIVAFPIISLDWYRKSTLDLKLQRHSLKA